MSQSEYEFSNQDRQLVVSEQDGTFGSPYDYIRLTIYPSESSNNIVRLPGTENQAIFYSSLNETSFDINISPFGIGTDVFNTYSIGGDSNDFKIYKNGEDVYIKPNEIFNDYGLPQGNYRIQVDFLNQVNPPIQSPATDEGDEPIDDDLQEQQTFYQFIIKQISTSRKEVRLRLLDGDITNDSVEISNITQALNFNQDEFLEDGITPNPNYKYQFKHILNIGSGDHNPIMNYTFDRVTDGKENQTLILKLYDALPLSIQNLSMVTIEREVLITQTENIYYFSDVEEVFFGDGIPTDESINYDTDDGFDIEFQNYNDLSQSISSNYIEKILSGSTYDYPNLNTDFSKFVNHTFFGSAKVKIVNFKNKIETIQGHYSNISKSLFSSGVKLDTEDSSYVKQYRKTLFNNIDKEINSFTPYERFLYFDGQSESTASAPGLSEDYAHNTPLRSDTNNLKQLNGYDGFNVVYKTDNLSDELSSTEIPLTRNKYKVQDKPFFNYSGSVYLSFLLKGTDNLQINRDITNNNISGTQQNGFLLPYHSAYTASLQQPTVTGSEYRRYIYEASQSYWSALNPQNDLGLLTFNDFSDLSKIEILSSSIKVGSNKILDSSNIYPTTVISHSGITFEGSVMPAGDLFSIGILSGSSITQSFITDVKVSLTNPSDVLPFDNIYHTSSAEWTNWYNDMLTKAETFDTDNIHSFENNLPLYIQESSDYNDMKDFLSLQGEQYDIIKNHVDSLGTLHNRGYKKTNSPPKNTYPILLNNIGWNPIQPFTSSISEYFGNSLSSVTTVDDITSNTYRKTLNNLLYIYKSKGTKNSVRGLLNTYGYPADVLQFQEFGGSTNNQVGDGNIIDDIAPDNQERSQNRQTDLDLSHMTGSIGYTIKKQKLYRYIVGNNSDKILNLNWWMDSADLNTIEFIYKHVNTTATQTILKSSGSGTENLWDLRLIPSSDGFSSSFEFRLNNSNKGGSAIGSRAFSMSLAYNNMSDGQLWNVMVQRMTSSAVGVGVGTNEYRLHSSLQTSKEEGQEKVLISPYGYVTMSISGGSVGGGTPGGLGFYANQNWTSTGSRGSTDYSNLFVGETVSGSLAEIRGWSSALSISRFRQHTLNKFSTTGNSINSHRKELVYNFKLNENYTSSSISSSTQNIYIVDSSPKTTYKDYSFLISGSLLSTYSTLYGYDLIDVVNFSLQDNNKNKENDNNIFINPNQKVRRNLNPDYSSIKPLTDKEDGKADLITSDRLDLYPSPQNFINKYILNNMAGSNFEKYYGNPKYYNSQSYDEFDTLRREFFESHNIKVDTNKFIRAHENIFNDSIIEGITSLTPARTNTSVGIEIKPTILEKQKYEHEHYSVETNPNTFTSNITTTPDLSNSSLETEKTGSISINNSIVETGNIESPYTASIGRGYIPFGTPNSISSSLKPSTTGSCLVLPYTASLSLNDTKTTVIEKESVTSTKANLSFTFTNTGSDNTKITLVSFDSYGHPPSFTDLTYEASASFANGTKAASGNILFATGSQSSSAASNFLAAVTSSNGHGTKFTVSQGTLASTSASGVVTLFQSVAGVEGNTFVTYTDPVAPTFLTSTQLQFNGGKSTEKTRILMVKPSISLSGSTLVLPHTGSIDYASIANESFVNIHDNWGTSSTDVHFVNFAGGLDAYGTYNTNHIDTRNHFYSIGDVETYSGSDGNHTNFSDINSINNAQIISDGIHSTIKYESFINGNPGIRTGRAMGKTRYFFTGSDGTITLPSNHVSKFSQPFKETMCNGAQNQNPGILNVQDEDYSSASFYRVKVTGGENQIIVKSPKYEIDSDDKIIY